MVAGATAEGTMRLIDKDGCELQLGDEIAVPGQRGTWHLSALDSDRGIIFLFTDAGDGRSLPLKPADIGAKFAA